MKRTLTLLLFLIGTLVIVGCSMIGNGSQTGTIRVYSQPTKEFTVPVSSTSIELTEQQIRKLKAIIRHTDDWIDDHAVDRLAYYFDGEFAFSDSEFIYYFTYEHNVIYYDHYFSEITSDEMQFIRDIVQSDK